MWRWRRKTKRTINHKGNTWYCCVWNCCRRRELSICESSCFPLYVWKRENKSFTLKIYCIVQWQNVHLALLLLSSANVHSLKEKRNGFKPNGATPSEVTSTSFKGSSFTLSHLLSVVKLHVWIKEKLQNPFTGSTFFSVIFGLIILALQCCSQRLFSIFILQTNLSRKHKNCHSAWPCGNMATVNIHSQGFL